MTTERELLERIYASPDDNQPRLVYADWLTSQDDPRGELIVLQCRGEDDEAHRKLKVRENRLLKEHASAWTAGLPAAAKKPVFRRGFIDELSVDLTQLPDPDVLFAAAPLLRRLRLDIDLVKASEGAPPPSLAPLLASVGLARLAALDVRVYGIGDEGARQIAASPHVRNLRSLRLSGVNGFLSPNSGKRFGRESIEALASSPNLKNLTHLDLSENMLAAQDLAGLSGDWALESLDVGNNGLDAAALPTLAKASLPRLRHLGLAGTICDEPGIAELVASLTKLDSLDLERCHLGPLVGKLFGKGALPNLKALRLERNRLADAGAVVIAESSRGLTDLEMGHNLVGKRGAAALASSPNLVTLQRLTLNEPRWKDETIDLFRKSTTLAGCRIYVKGHLLSR